jgi:hypothetical protein
MFFDLPDIGFDTDVKVDTYNDHYTDVDVKSNIEGNTGKASAEADASGPDTFALTATETYSSVLFSNAASYSISQTDDVY